MKIIISKDKNGKQIVKYKSADGLIFDRKNHCEFYEDKHMWKVKKESDNEKIHISYINYLSYNRVFFENG